jgi:hypothetical protein
LHSDCVIKIDTDFPSLIRAWTLQVNPQMPGVTDRQARLGLGSGSGTSMAW